jgi:hypothetical protein
MTTEEESQINIFRCLDFIRDNSSAYAKAKADRVYMEEFRKSKKALLMKAAEARGHNAFAAQEREAYADQEYQEHIAALGMAVEAEETLRWRIIAAQAKIACWQTLEATRRLELKVIP